ncbi:hypothetical protein ACFV2H_51270, partial [Streptomyces sp. NPDC059629]|uniref:hypothetical protein n=1 Tax=Streptomyces sp. NPDC059629 TaxID=3346889 RepID=UPI0036CC3CA8
MRSAAVVAAVAVLTLEPAVVTPTVLTAAVVTTEPVVATAVVTVEPVVAAVAVLPTHPKKNPTRLCELDQLWWAEAGVGTL